MRGLPLQLPPLGNSGGAQVTTMTNVQLSKSNFRLVKADVVWESTGFKFLGIITFRSPEYVEALSRLYKNAGVAEGRSQTFVNLVYDQTQPYFLLFSLPKIMARGDLIGFEGIPRKSGR